MLYLYHLALKLLTTFIKCNTSNSSDCNDSSNQKDLVNEMVDFEQ